MVKDIYLDRSELSCCAQLACFLVHNASFNLSIPIYFCLFLVIDQTLRCHVEIFYLLIKLSVLKMVY